MDGLRLVELPAVGRIFAVVRQGQQLDALGADLLPVAAVGGGDRKAPLLAGFGKAEILVPLALAAQAHEVGASRFGVGHRPLHQLLHVALSPGAGMDGHGADAVCLHNLPVHGKFQGEAAHHPFDFPVLQRQVVMLRHLRVILIELGQQGRKIGLKNHIAEINQVLVFLRRCFSIFRCHVQFLRSLSEFLCQPAELLQRELLRPGRRL